MMRLIDGRQPFPFRGSLFVFERRGNVMHTWKNHRGVQTRNKLPSHGKDMFIDDHDEFVKWCNPSPTLLVRVDVSLV
jgi:hypothetical protein